MQRRAEQLHRPSVVNKQHLTLHVNTIHRESLKKMRPRQMANDIPSLLKNDNHRVKKRRINPDPAERLDKLRSLLDLKTPTRYNVEDWKHSREHNIQELSLYYPHSTF